MSIPLWELQTQYFIYHFLRLPLLTSLESPLSFYSDNLPVELFPSSFFNSFPFVWLYYSAQFSFCQVFFQKFLKNLITFVQINILLKNIANFLKCVKI